MMRAKPTYDSPSKHPIPRLRFSRNAKRVDMEDAKMALGIIIHPSLQLCKLALARSALTALRRPQKTAGFGDISDVSSEPPKKRVRFDEQPVTITRRSFFERCGRNLSSSPTRSCLVVRPHDDLSVNFPQPPPLETDERSVYEDCLSDHPGFLADLQVLEGDEPSNVPSLKPIRRSEFYETDSGIATFDRTGYANYCLSRWLEKQREEARASTKLVLEDPVFQLGSNFSLSPPSDNTPCAARLVPQPPLPPHVCIPPRSFPGRLWKLVEDELQNAVVVLTVGLFIHICLFLFLLYDILTRGFIPSDD